MKLHYTILLLHRNIILTCLDETLAFGIVFSLTMQMAPLGCFNDHDY